MITAETRENAENLLFQEGHHKCCKCMPCRLLRHLFMDSEGRIEGCQFEDCANLTLSPPDAERRLCADHRCPAHSSDEEQDFTPRAYARRPAPTTADATADATAKPAAKPARNG